MSVDRGLQVQAASTCTTSTPTQGGHSVPEYLALELRLSPTPLRASGMIGLAVPMIFWATLRAVELVQDRLNV
jgi:hypothetical protein